MGPQFRATLSDYGTQQTSTCVEHNGNQILTLEKGIANAESAELELKVSK